MRGRLRSPATVNRYLNSLSAVFTWACGPEAMLNDAIATHERIHGGDADPGVASALNELAIIAMDRKDYDNAENAFRRILAIYRRVYTEDHTREGIILANLAGVYLKREDYRASWAKMVGLLTKMHKAGIPIVAGTDGSGIEIVHELEIYEEAGFTAGEALAAATIVPARLVGQDKHTGSIKMGKAADLVLVEGDPSSQIVGFGTIDVSVDCAMFTEGQPHPYIPLLAVNPDATEA